jgi:hypothetical protein
VGELKFLYSIPHCRQQTRRVTSSLQDVVIVLTIFCSWLIGRSSGLTFDGHVCWIFNIKFDLTSILFCQVAGYLSNMGQGLIFTVDNSSKPSINLTGGPLSYKYEWHQMALHFGLNNQSGSEHMIAGRAFPAEVSVIGSYRRQSP